MSDRAKLKKDVVSKVDLTYLLEKHPIGIPNYSELDMQLAFSGDGEALFYLAWQIVLSNRLTNK